MADLLFVSDEELNEERLRAALCEHGLDCTVLCGDMRVWLIANRILLPLSKHDVGGTTVRVGEPSELVKLDDTLGAGRWALR